MQVMQFWKKAERVMVYKRQSQLDARKKVAMDKHLSFLVGALYIVQHRMIMSLLAGWLCCLMLCMSTCTSWCLVCYSGCRVQSHGSCWHVLCTA